MKYIVIILCVVFSAFTTLTQVFGLDADQMGKILDNFKRQEREMIFESDAMLIDEEDAGILDTYRRLNLYGAIGENIRSKREYLQSQNEKISNRVDSLESSVAQLDREINSLVAEVNSINEQVISTKRKVESNTEKIAILKRKIEENSEILLEYLVYLYKKGESVSSQDEMDNFKTILFSGQPIDEILNDLYFTSIIQVTGQHLIENHRRYIAELYVKQIELNKAEDELKALRKIGVLEKNILDDKRAAKERLLSVTRGQEELYAKYVAEKLEDERGVKIRELRERIKLNNTKRQLLEKYNCEFVDIKGNQDDLFTLSQQCIDINKIIYAESRLTSITKGSNPFDWPVPPYAGISAFFRDEAYAAQFGDDHDAIDIVVPQGTDIKAPADGYVIFIQPPTNSSYAYVALKHSDNLVTLYGHVSEVMVGQYDFVRRGDVFAKSGGEYGTPGAGILSTGPHLHFVVYENEEYDDPLEYLNISYLRYEDLPERYEFKYKSDFRSRKGYEFTSQTSTSSSRSRFRIEGETEIERQKFLLNTYAAPAFRNWDMWVEEAVGGGIDPTFMMCVGLAESGLGRNLKTAFNVGNVGNTDSGSTYTFTSPRQGIYWMTQTFNNRYLSQYNEIQELSRYGNTDPSKPIYASSDFNWHNNITKCMSHVKGEYIPDDYRFRINIRN